MNNMLLPLKVNDIQQNLSESVRIDFMQVFKLLLYIKQHPPWGLPINSVDVSIELYREHLSWKINSKIVLVASLPKIMSMRTHFELICISNFHI